MAKGLTKLSSVTTLLLSLITVWIFGKMIAQQFEEVTSLAMPELKQQSTQQKISGVDSYLFGEPPKNTAVTKPAAPAAKSETIVATKLNLVLLGVIDLGERGVAIVQNGNKTQVVAVNEDFMPKVTLVDVFAEGILINNRGKSERLLLDQKDKGTLVNQLSAKAPAPSAMVGRLSEQEQAQLNTIGDTLRKSPMSISKYIKFQPLNENGQWVGVKIWANSDPKLYQSLGFAEGDILREVNGNSIQDMVKDPKLWQTFLSLDQFDLVVERNGSPQMINVNFR